MLKVSSKGNNRIKILRVSQVLKNTSHEPFLRKRLQDTRHQNEGVNEERK